MTTVARQLLSRSLPRLIQSSAETRSWHTFTQSFSSNSTSTPSSKFGSNLLEILQESIDSSKPTLKLGLSSDMVPSTGPKENLFDSIDSKSIFSSSYYLSRSSGAHILHISANKNNTICTLTDSTGATLCWTSAGTCGLKKAARGTSDAGHQAVLALTEKVESKNITMSNGIHLRIAGFGPGREQAFRAVRAAGWSIVRISDYTSYRHAGCRPRKKRRL